ncbi:glycoside hydrolase family 64 protein [Amniculicola lignicola CBS 123094]|uniref:Glycoside hydrolase family 64 protein n=1 Tax=Amniculicola lignicola CBS 123094 TaxID=1392246 RepID=A0A6A5WFQ3_9PLEO|nr:glycoside hydrolase family 64 protein [Amniculicola lignicola CBS 123094]
MGAVRNFITKFRILRRPSNTAAPKANEGQTLVAPEISKNTLSVTGQGEQQQVLAAATPGTLNIALQNKTSSSNVFAYITGLVINNGNRPSFIQADGRTVYSPASPSKAMQHLAVDCAIPLGAPGNTVHVNIPKMAGGRIWFSVDARLTFFINPGPAIVEPSVTNPSDPNINLNWTFCEFTFNDAQLFANISYVDFVSVPVGMSITNTAGKTQIVPGMPSNGFDTVVKALRAQAAKDRRPWDQLIYSHNGRALRALSPNNLIVANPNAWGDYWNAYVQQVWSRFATRDIIINTQAAAGNLRGRVKNGQLTFPEAGSFSAPSAKDIFSCSTGPFQTGSNQARNAVIPRLAAAFNRSTLLDGADQFPNGSTPPNYYKNATTNWYSKIVHQVQRDGRGYAFPYDDVVPDGGQDVAGTVFDGSPKLFTVSVGGG